MPATRSGTGEPSTRLAQTIDWPSASTMPQPVTASLRRSSWRIATTFAAFTMPTDK